MIYVPVNFAVKILKTFWNALRNSTTDGGEEGKVYVTCWV